MNGPVGSYDILKKKNGFLGLNPSFWAKKNHTLLSFNHALATTGKSFANQKIVPFSQTNISLLADPVKISKFSSGKATRQAKGVALLPMAHFSCDGPISTSLFDFGTSMSTKAVQAIKWESGASFHQHPRTFPG